MASLDRHLNPLYAIKECSSCGNLHTKNCGWSIESLEDKILVPIPDLSQRPLKIKKNCLDCRVRFMGLYCRQCALIRRHWRSFSRLQAPCRVIDDDTNFVNQEPFVVKQDPGAHIGFNCPTKVSIISKPEPCNDQTVNEFPQTLPSVHPTSCSRDENSFTYDSKPNFVDDSPNVFNPPPQPPMYSCEFCGNDARYEGRRKANCGKSKWLKIDIGRFPFATMMTRDYKYCKSPPSYRSDPVSYSMGDKHLDTILATESDEVIKSSVENLVPIPSESEGIHSFVCDVPLCNNPTPLGSFQEHSETIIDSNNDYSSSDDDSYENINYVDASPPDAEIVSLEVVEIVILEVGGIDDDILLTIKDDILREKLLNVNLLIANIEALKDNPIPSSNFVIKSPSTFPNSFLEETNTFDNSLAESKTFCFNLEEISSGSTTTHFDYSLPNYEAFYDDHIEEKSSGSTTTHADFSQYDSFIFDLSINPFPPADRSDFYHKEFADELAHIISPPEMSRIFEASRARGFALLSQELQILSFIWESDILILSTNVYL
ncbi:hypothetical protein Tco_0722878 [Tanacetum coccineum]